MYNDKGLWFLCIFSIFMSAIFIIPSLLIFTGEQRLAGIFSGIIIATPGLVLLYYMIKEVREICKEKKSRI